MYYMFLFSILTMISSNVFAFDHSHGPWNTILSEHVTFAGKQSLFNYVELKNDTKTLDKYLESLSAVSVSDFSKFNQSQQLAFLINAYNAFTVKLIIKHYPVESIKDIGSFFTSPWKKKFFKLLGQKQHLDEIEHGIIREKYKEPRIHFAVNCASIGCPSLYPKAFIATKLNEQLDEAASHFINNEKKNILVNKKLYLSKIFKWYGSDFGDRKKMLSYIGKVMGRDLSKTSIRYKDYDWKLNEAK